MIASIGAKDFPVKHKFLKDGELAKVHPCKATIDSGVLVITLSVPGFVSACLGRRTCESDFDLAKHREQAGGFIRRNVPEHILVASLFG